MTLPLCTRPRVSYGLRLGLYLFLLCVLLANLEIQIEGPNGWATSLPTWRTASPSVTWIYGGRPVTGYHVFLSLFLLVFFHFPLLFVRPTLEVEGRILYSYAIVAVVWDFLWFVFNPHFGLEKYSPEFIWWFRNWFLRLPADYFFGLGLSLVLWLIPSLVARKGFVQSTSDWVVPTATLIALAAITAGVSMLFT